MSIRKLLPFILFNLFFCVCLKASDRSGDLVDQIPPELRLKGVYVHLDPIDWASLSRVCKQFQIELSSPLKNALKDALSQADVAFNSNDTYGNLSTLYRASLRYRNWTTDISSDPTFPENNSRSLNRLCLLPLKEQLIGFCRTDILKLAIDNFSAYETFHYKIPFLFVNKLLEDSRSLQQCIKFNEVQMDLTQWQEVFDALSTQKKIIGLEFSKTLLTEDTFAYLCQQTDPDWRNKVKKLQFTNISYKLSSNDFSNILTAFSNIRKFKSCNGCCLMEPIAISTAFPLLNKLHSLTFAFDHVAEGVLIDLSKHLDKMPKLMEIDIFQTPLNDNSVHALLEIKRKRPMLKLICFDGTDISSHALQEVVKCFEELGYPQVISVNPIRESSIVEAYNQEWKERKK